jgi:hypothetical protein
MSQSAYYGEHSRVRVRDQNGQVVIDWRGRIGVYLLDDGSGRVILQRQRNLLGLFTQTYALADGESYEAFNGDLGTFLLFWLHLLFIAFVGALILHYIGLL